MIYKQKRLKLQRLGWADFGVLMLSLGIYQVWLELVLAMQVELQAIQRIEKWVIIRSALK